MKKASNITILFFLFSFLYSILRYNIFGTISWEQIPIYVLNKSVAFTAVFCISLSGIWNKLPTKDPLIKKYLGLQGFFLAIIHAMLSVVILSQTYYPSIFSKNMLNFKGNCTILFGVLALMCFLLASIYSLPFFITPLPKIKAWVFSGSIILIAHISVKSWEGWKLYTNWPGYMFPISLLSFLMISITIISKIKARK